MNKCLILMAPTNGKNLNNSNFLLECVSYFVNRDDDYNCIGLKYIYIYNMYVCFYSKIIWIYIMCWVWVKKTNQFIYIYSTICINRCTYRLQMYNIIYTFSSVKYIWRNKISWCEIRKNAYKYLIFFEHLYCDTVCILLQ